jgi:serine/threonine protein kinase
MNDTLLGKMVVSRGLATDEEIEAAMGIARGSGNAPRALADVLVEHHIVTKRQLARLRMNLEGDRAALRIPGYQIMRKLGAGAMATVYLAKQLSLDRLVAIKILPRKFLSDPIFVERFYKEGRAAAKLSDPNIVGAFDVGQVGEHHYFVMEYVDGETVFDKLHRDKRIDERTALEITRQVASALKHAHAQGFIHRDVKPKNLMIAKGGSVKLADLGLARAVADKEAAAAERNKAFGTPYYISPEQIRGATDIGAPSDIYGLGATLYHMLTGRVPFEGKSPTEVMQKHLKAPLVPPDHLVPSISSDAAEIVEMMMAKVPANRYQSASDLLEDINLVLAGNRPRHAHRGPDVSSIAADVEQAADTAPVRATRQSASTSPVLLVTLAASVLINLVLLLIVLLRR